MPIGLLILGLAAAPLPGLPSATTPTPVNVEVTTLTDTLVVNDNVCSLREAIAVAGGGQQTTGNASNGCRKTETRGVNSISFAPALFSTGPAVVHLVHSSVLIQLGNPIAINGPGAGLLTLDAGASSRLFDISSSAVTLRGLTLTAGKLASGNGGAISSTAPLTLTGMRLVGNEAAGDGGAILQSGPVSLTLTDSELAGNTAAGSGGAIRLQGGAGLHITGSQLTGNQAQGDGGAIDVEAAPQSSPVTLNNTLVSGNTAVLDGGGLRLGLNGGALVLTGSTLADNSGRNGAGLFLQDVSAQIANSTLSGNSATATAGSLGGGIYAQGGSVALSNVTLAGNAARGGGDSVFIDRATRPTTLTASNTLFSSAGAACRTSSGAALASGSGNLVANAAGNDASCGTSQALARQVATDALRLAPLSDNGGPTQTLALQAGSVALDTGVANGCQPVDQRGVPRPQHGACDIGAFELASAVTFNDLAGRAIQISADSGQVEAPAVLAAQPAGAPADFSFPFGFFSYRVTALPVGATVGVTITLPPGNRATAVFKCDATGASCSAYPLAAIDENRVLLTLVDGGPGDSDLRADGSISDPVGIALPAAAVNTTPLDTGGALGALGLMVLGLAGAARRIRRRA
ncbi:MAG TPA: CSLREA domain-containing protein [Solimonas sp.]|nr:CSLREA domain-containing protein [Solimonas sp.]